MNIGPHLYDLWLSALVSTVAEYDDQFSQQVEEAWRHVLAPGIEYLKSKY